MLKDEFARECKVCGRPYTVFKWSPGVGLRWKKTEICQTCSKIKNACQTCILDLDYHIHTKERDEILGTHNAIPLTDVNSQLYVRRMEQEFGDALVVNHGKAESAAKEVLKKLVRQTADPFTQKTKVVYCQFYKKGNCKREQECPFRHEMPLEKSLTKTALKKGILD
jgi:pre-mRNA-splicing factor RBM22/SLT11